MLSKFRKATSASHNKSISKTADSSKEDNLDESGEYVTITDVKNNNKPVPASLSTPQRSEIPEPVRESNINKTWESLEYVSLNEIPTNPSDLHSPDVLSGSSNESSLERRKRQGARVTLDSEGKVVYSSDSLRRRKGAHTTFAPGQHVKDPSVSPSPSPVANHRTPKAIIRPVQQQTPVNHDDSWSKSPLRSSIRSSMSGTLSSSNGQKSDPVLRAAANELNGPTLKPIGRIPTPATDPKEVSSEPHKASTIGQLSDLSSRRNRVIIRAGISSPTKEVTKNMSPMRSLSPRSVAVPRGAHVQMPPDRSVVKTHSAYLQTDFDGPEDLVKAPEGKMSDITNRNALTLGNGIDGEACKNQKVKRSASYRMANFSPLISVCNVDIDKDEGGGDVDLGVADLGESPAKLCLSSLSGLSPSATKYKTENVQSVLNPNAAGRRFYGAQVMVRPTILLSLSPNRVTKPADTQRARVLSKSGNDTEIW